MKKEEEEKSKFIMLESLKYERAIKGMDRMTGLKENLMQFEEKLLEKLFARKEAGSELRFVLRKNNTASKIDGSKPLYLDDLKRLEKF